MSIRVYMREFENANLKLTAVMHRVTAHSHRDDSPYREFCLELLDILTGKVPVVHAGPEIAADMIRAKAAAASPENDKKEVAPIVVTEEQVTAAIQP